MEEDLKTQWILMGMILCALLISFALGYYVELQENKYGLGRTRVERYGNADLF